MSTKGHKWLAASIATLIAEPAFALAHQGGVGVILGLAAGAAAYALLDDVERLAGKPLSSPASRKSDRPAEPGSHGKRRLAYRLLVGKSVCEEADAGDIEPDTEALGDADDQFAPLDRLELGELRPHVDSVFSNRLAILGMSGSGKSNLVAVLVEELGQFDAPLIVFDLKPEYWTLCRKPYLLHPARVSAQNVAPQQAIAIGQQIAQRRLQVVVDLTSYQNEVDAALVMIKLIDGVERWQRAQPEDKRLPCTFVLDEAHYWLPENEGHSTIRGAKHPQSGVTLLSLVQQVFFHVATMGRSLGMGLIIADQRPADVDKRLISQAEWRFVLKTMEPADLKVYRTYGVSESVAQALNPRSGEAYVLGPDGSRGVYHIRRRLSPDVARSPGLANIRNAGVASEGHRTTSSTFPHGPAELPATARWSSPGLGRAGWAEPGSSREGSFEAVSARTGDDFPAFGRETGRPGTVQDFPPTRVNELEEPSDLGPKEYRLTEQEIPQFIGAYRACGSIEKALAAIGRGGWYKKHASELVRNHHLRRDA